MGDRGADLRVGQKLGDGRFWLIEALGQGGCGEVWRAHDAARDEQVALKALNRGARSGDLERFDREIRTMARLHHPAIVEIYDADTDAATGRRFYTMELLRGGPLSPVGGTLNEVLGHFEAILAPLAYAHAFGVVHRDLKPDNVFVLEDGTIKLLDFGIVRLRRDTGLSSTVHGLMLGTPTYMSPEQAVGDHDAVGPASDLYSLGVMLYEALSGDLPFTAQTALGLINQHVNHPPEPLETPPGVSEVHFAPIARFVDQLLAKSYSARPESAAEALQLLQKAAAALPANLPLNPLPLRAPIRDVRTIVTEPSSQDSSEPPPRVGGAWHLRFMRELPPIGRASELAELTTHIERAWHTPNPSLSILGSKGGLGKHHLAHWLTVDLSTRRPVRVLELALDTCGGLAPAMQSGLRTFLRAPPLEPKPTQDRIRTILGGDEARIEALSRFLVTTAGRWENDDARIWHWALSRMASSQTPRPLLLWIHGGTEREETAAWLAQLLSRPDAQRWPMAAIWSLRGDAQQSPIQALTAQPWTRITTLGPLSDTASGALIDALVPDLSYDTRDALVDACDGNPLSIRETLRHWWATDALESTPEGFALRSTSTTQKTTLDTVFRNQLATLAETHGPDAINALQTLAWIGPTFSPHQVALALDDQAMSLDDLERGGWLVAFDRGTTPTRSFYSEALRRLLRRDAMAARGFGALIGRCAEVCLIEGHHAIMRSDWEGANTHIERARILQEAHRPTDHHGTLHALEAQARLSARQRDARGVRSTVQALRRASERLDDDAADRFIRRARLWEGEAAALEHSDTDAQRILRSLTEAPSEPLCRGAAHHRLGALAMASGDLTAASMHLGKARQAFLQAGESAATISERLLTHTRGTGSLTLQAAVVARLGKVADALHLLSQALVSHRDLEDLQGEALAHLQKARLLRRQVEGEVEGRGDLTREASGALIRAESLMAGLDDRRGHALVAWERAALEAAQGHYDDAERSYMAASHLFAAAMDTRGMVQAINGCGESARSDGRLSDALAHYRWSRDVSTRSGDAIQRAIALLNMGWTGLALDRAGDAEVDLRDTGASFERADALFADTALTDARALARIGRAEVALRKDRHAEVVGWLKLAHSLGAGPVEDPDGIDALERLRAGLPDGVQAQDGGVLSALLGLP